MKASTKPKKPFKKSIGEYVKVNGKEYKCRIVCLKGTGAVRIGPLELENEIKSIQGNIGIQPQKLQHWCYKYIPSKILTKTDEEIRDYIEQNL